MQEPSPLDPPRVAFSIARSVGSAPTRNRVRRRLRAAVREQRELLRPGTSYLLGASPAAAHASYAQLTRDLRALLEHEVSP
jgi:ribonuclease P protein component